MPYFGPEESEITAGDYSQFFQYGMYGLMGSVTGLAREYGGADVGAILKPTQGGLRESQEAQLGDMTSAGRELFQSDIFSSEFYDSPVGWATAQAMGMAPYMAASILPVIATGGYGGLALGAISSGILTDADMTSSVQDLVDTATHEDLLKSKQYADDIEGGFSEQEARQNLLDTMLGPGAHATAIGLGALSAGLGVERITGGAAGRVLGRGAAGKLIPKPSGGVISTAAKETVLGGGAEFGEEAGTETLIERAEITGGLREDYDPGRIARAGATGAIIGGPIGTVGGAIEGFGRGGKKTTAEPAKPSTEIDPAVEAAARGQPVVPVSGGTGGAPVSPPAGTKPSAIPITTAASGVAGGTVPAVTGPAPTGAPARAGAPTPASPGPLTGGAIPTLSEKVTKLADPISPSPEVTAALAAKTPPAPQAQAQAPPATPPARVPPAQPTPSPAAVPPARVPPQQPVPAGEQIQAGMPPLKTNVPPAAPVPPGAPVPAANVPPAAPVPQGEQVQAGIPPLRPNVPPAAPVPAANVPPMQPVPQGAPVPAARVPPAQPIPAPGQPVVPQGAPLAQRPLPIQSVPPVGRVAPVAPPQAIVEPAPVAPAPVEAVVTPEVRGPKVLEAIQTVTEKKAERRALAKERLERIKANQDKRAALGPEETAALHEAQVETGKIGPKEKAKKASDKAGAKKLFDKHAPDPETRETDEEVKTRINAIADEANKTGTRMPDRIKVNTTEQIWLADVKKLKAAFDKGKATADHIATFLYRERALKTGDEAPLREERKATGKEQSQAKQELKEEVAVDAGIPKEDIPVSQQMEEATVVEAEAEEITEVAPREKRPASKAERIKQVSEERAAKKKEEAETKEVAKEKAEYEARVTSEVAKPSKPVLVASKARPKLPLKMRFREALRRLDRNPTAAEIAAGNARTAQFSWHGLDVVIQKLKGMMRFDNRLPAHYGHIRGTKGADGRPVDVYIGPNIDSNNAFVVDQVNKFTGEFDEHKVLIGFDSHEDAVSTYEQAITGPGSPVTVGDVTPMTVEELKTWVKDKEVTSEPVGAPELAEEAEVLVAAKGAPNYGVTSYVTEEVANKYASGLASWKDKLDKLGATPASFGSWRDTLIPLMEAGLFGRGVSNRILPRIFDGITNAIADVPVYIISDAEMQSVTGHYVPAAYNHLQNIIVFSESHSPTGIHHKVFPRIMVHEGIHAAFIKATFENNNIRAFVTDVAREFREALDAAGHSTDFYAFQDVHEFLAETFSNPTMQRALAQTKASPALRKALVDARAKPFGKPIRTLWDAIRRVVGSVIGLKGTETENTLLDAMMIAAADLQSTPTGINPGAMSAVEVYEMRDQENWESSDPDSPWEINPQEVNFPSLALAGPKNFSKVGDYLPENFRPREGTFQTKTLANKFRSMDGLAQLAKDFGDTFAKHVRDLYNAVQGLHVRQLDLFRQSEKFIAEIHGLSKKYAGPVWQHFAEYLHSETEAGVYGDRALDDQPHLGKDGGKNVLDSQFARNRHPELAAEWAKIPPELQALRTKMLAHYKGQYEGAAQEIIENIVIRLTGKENNELARKIYAKEDLTPDELAQLGDKKELINHIRHTRELGKIKGPYYPLMRIGQYVASGTYKFTPPSDGAVVKDTQNTFEFSGDKARERAIRYANTQRNYTRVTKTWVDPATGEVFFEDVNDEGTPIQVKAGPTIPEAEARYRVFVQDQYTEFFDTLKDAQVADFELRKNTDYTPSHLGPRQFNPFEQSKRGIMSNEINQLLDTMYKRPEFNQMTPEAKHDLEKALRELSLRMHGSTRIQARGLPRRNVLGASRDTVKVALQHAEAMAGYRAKLQMQRHIDSARDAMTQAVSTDEGGGQKSWAARQAISNEMVERTARIQTQAAPSKMDEWTNRLTTVSFVHYLMSPAYSINNFLQVAMLAYPQLAAKYGSGTAIRLLMKSYKDMGVGKVLKAGGKETLKAFKPGQIVRHNFLTEVLSGIHDSGEKAMLEYLRSTGSITPESGLEIDRQISGGKIDKMADYMQGIARAMPAAIETINRVTVGLTAYRAEMKKSGSHEKAILSAQEMVNLTQGNYSSSNMPAFFNHPLGRLALQFKKYGFTVYGQLGHNIGLIMRDASPGDRAQGAKALAGLAATHVIMAGALGLPTEPIRWLITGANIGGLTEANWGDVENWVREAAAGTLGPLGGELLTRGIPRMFGIDVSERIGMQSLLTQRADVKPNDEQSIQAFFGEMTMGAPGSMVFDVLGGFNDVMHGDFLEGAGKALPIKSLRDNIKAYSMATEGKRTAAGYEVLPPAGIADTILRGLGYRTAQEAEITERRSYVYSAKARLERQRGDLMREWHQATPNERLRIWGQIEQYNRTVAKDARLTRTMVQDYSKRKKSEDVVDGFPLTKTNRDLIRSTQGTYVTR